MTTMKIWLSTIVLYLSILCLSSLTQGQQTYYGFAPGNCEHEGNSVLGYSCNGVNRSCPAYLLFRARPPYNTIQSISDLLNSEPIELSEINSVAVNATIETERMVIVPVNCTCSGEYYQAYASYFARPGDTYLFISNNTFQGLSSCESVISENGGGALVEANTMVTVPLRCACPTKHQRDAGIRYLLTYDITFGDTYEEISDKFGVDNNLLLEANNVSLDITVFPFTTLLVPLQNPPNSSMTIMPPSTSPPLPPPTSPPDSGSKKTWIYVVVGVIAGGVVISISGIIYCAFVRKKNRQGDATIISSKFKDYEKPTEKSKSGQEPEDILQSLHDIAQSMKVYKFDELQSATDNFSDKYWIRGSVYRGIFNGDIAAIKKLSGDVYNEVAFMKKTNHLNLVKLVGVGFNDGHWYLVYEYATNGSLDEWIYYNNNDEKFLSWTQRIQIALDVSTGLNYLHSFTNPPHIHMDINSSNILLDSDFRAKISNFARARSAEGREGQFTLTRHIVGTRGYMAPEYLDHGLVSPKLDIYALGVLVLEVLTGKEAAEFCGKGNADLSDFLNSMLLKSGGEDSLEDLIDPSMQGSYPSELVLFMFKLIDSCIKKNPAARPDINEIVQSISKVLDSSFSWEMSTKLTGNKNLS